MPCVSREFQNFMALLMMTGAELLWTEAPGVHWLVSGRRLSENSTLRIILLKWMRKTSGCSSLNHVDITHSLAVEFNQSRRLSVMDRS